MHILESMDQPWACSDFKHMSQDVHSDLAGGTLDITELCLSGPGVINLTLPRVRQHLKRLLQLGELSS